MGYNGYQWTPDKGDFANNFSESVRTQGSGSKGGTSKQGNETAVYENIQAWFKAAEREVTKAPDNTWLRDLDTDMIGLDKLGDFLKAKAAADEEKGFNSSNEGSFRKSSFKEGPVLGS